MTQNALEKKSIDARQKSILFHLIAEYVASGRPVSSLSLAQCGDLRFSPATIRRELHVLTEMGYLAQPHTSAGRIPTDSAFRAFVDALKNGTVQPPSPRGQAAVQRLRTIDTDSPETRQEVVRILSDFLFQAALVITPSLSESVIRRLQFISFAPGTLLAVVITREGLVHNTYVKTPTAVDEHELEQIHNCLEPLISGRTLNEIRDILRGELADAKKKCDAVRERATQLGAEALKSGVGEAPGLVVDGRSYLAAQPELRGRLEKLMSVLEEKRRILALLDQAANTDEGPLVIIGREGGEAFEGCAMISAPFGSGGAEGRIGVLGSSRMDYKAGIPLVNIAAELLSRIPGEER